MRGIVMLTAMACAMVLLNAPSAAQSNPVVQSELARTAWRRASASNREGNADSAYADVQRAQTAWPMQAAYTETLLRLAVRRGDAALATSLLTQLASQEIGRGAAQDSTLLALAAGSPALERARTDVLTRTAPMTAAESIVSADSTFFAEGLDAEARSGTRYVTSLRHRNVLVVARDGSTRWLLGDNAPARLAVMGIALNPDGVTAWLATGRVTQAGTMPGDSALKAELLTVSLSTGAVESRVVLGDGTGMSGELTVAAHGEVLVSDAIRGRLYRLAPGATVVKEIVAPLLRSPQGIAVSDDGAHAIVADWSHGLLRWNLVDDVIEAVAVPDGVALLGIDGVRRWGRAVIAVQNGVRPMRVAMVTLSADGRRVERVTTIDRPQSPRGELTVGAIMGTAFTYVASSHWPFFGDDGSRLPNSGALGPATLRTVSLPAKP